MASYLRELQERDGLPAIRSSSSLFHDSSSRRVNFEDERHRARSPTGSLGHRSESPLYQPRPPSPGNSSGRRQMHEMQDQLKGFRDELQKKDSLIQQLVSMESIPKVNVRSQADSIRMDSLFMGDRQSLDTARSEVAALQVKNEKQQNKIRELDNEIEIRDVKVKEMKMMTETSRENESRLGSLVESLRGQVKDLEGRAGAFESVAGRSEFTVSALQKENKASQERIVELESRLRKQLEEREEAQARLECLDRKHKDLLSQFSSTIRIETLTGGIPTPEEIIMKLNELVQDNAMLKGKIMTLSETLNSTELETKASRETIMRLVSEVGKEKHMQSRYTSEFEGIRARKDFYDEENRMSQERYRGRSRSRSRSRSPGRTYPNGILRSSSLTRERDSERDSRREVDREVTLLRERLESTQRTLDATRSELDARENRLSSIQQEFHSSAHTLRSASQQLISLKERLSSLLSDSTDRVSCSEESIFNKIDLIVCANKELVHKINTMEDRVRTVTEQLEQQYELHKTAAHRARKSESETCEMRDRMRSFEGELAAGDVLRDGFRSDKEQYMRALQMLGEVMKMDRISADLGMDMTVDAIIARAEQLVKLEKDTLVDRTTHVYNLQRKVKSVKEQLESKDLHIDLLRKKITSLEEKLLGKTTIERERDGETLRIRKLEKQIDRLKMLVADARQENTNLKASLLGTSELKMHTMDQRTQNEELIKQVEDLEHVRKKQAQKIFHLKQAVDSSQNTSEESRVVADNAVQALSSELRTTKAALLSAQNREKQLVDFRIVVARMLGLDLNTLAIPDFEIVSRLEKLIKALHSHSFTTMSLEEALADMEDGFQCGYEDYRNTVSGSESQNIRRSRERVKRKAMKSRARSMSPTRRVTIDPRQY